MEKVLLGFAKRWIAGETIDDALTSVKYAYSNGRHAIVNKLGEYHKSKDVIKKTVDEYKIISSSFRKWKVRGAISIKPTQIGLTISKNVCTENFKAIIKNATNSHTFVWMDMESSDHTDNTIDIYYKLFSRYERLGIAIQANLRRSQHDLTDLLEHGAKIRLVKGAYREDNKIAFKTNEAVDGNYLKMMKKLFKNGNEFGIATHDSKMIQAAIKFSKLYPKKFEFQMLKGIREELKHELVKKKFVVTDYIPYGINWLPYSIRRIKERKRNLLLLGSSLLQSHRV